MMLATPASEWRIPESGQSKIWQRDMKSVTKKLVPVGTNRFQNYNSRNVPWAWLDTLHDMASNRTDCLEVNVPRLACR